MKLIVPLKIKQSKKKFFNLNLNSYRNAHFRTLHTVKINYQNAIRCRIQEAFAKQGGQIFDNPVEIWYTIFLQSNRRVDIPNIYSIVDKFVCDALVEEGVLHDDNFNCLATGGWKFGGIDKENPRAEVFIKEIQNGKNNR